MALDCAWVIVFHGRDYEICRERALVLRAVGIPCQLDFHDGYHRVTVAESDVGRARAELAAYELEAAQPPPEVLPVIPPRPGAVAGTIGYIVTLLAVAGLQTAAEIDLSNIPVPPNQGLFLLLQPSSE